MSKERVHIEWNPDMVGEIIDLYPTTSVEMIARKMGISAPTVHNVIKMARVKYPKLFPKRPRRAGVLALAIKAAAEARKN